MRRRRTHPIIIFFIVAVVAFFSLQFITKTGFFKVYGNLYVSENIPDDIKKSLEEVANGKNRISHDISVNMDYGLQSKEYLECNVQLGCYVNLLYDVLVPTTGFYNPKSTISLEELSDNAKNIFDAYLAKTDASDGTDNFISILDLTSDQKLLAVGENYYLDTLESGAIFIYVSIPIVLDDGKAFDLEYDPERVLDEDEKKIINLIKPTLRQFPTKNDILSFAQTGVTALSRGMLAKLNQVGGDASYFAANIKDFLSSKDLTHISNESSFTDYATSSNICADPRMIGAITAIGTDIVELTGNHNLDCGDEAAINTIDQYDELGIKTVGGGKNAEAAAKPLEINQKGTGVTFLAYNQSTGGATYDNTPGANQYYEEDVTKNIAAAKERGDIVIIDVQYYECSVYVSEVEDTACDYANSSAGDQIGLFRHLIDLGADIVVGTSAHQVQTYELYNGGTIYYGLGNLFFDQIWWPGTTRSLVLTHYFWNGKLLNTRIIPTVYDANMQVELMDEETSRWFIDRLNQARP